MTSLQVRFVDVASMSYLGIIDPKAHALWVFSVGELLDLYEKSSLAAISRNTTNVLLLFYCQPERISIPIADFMPSSSLFPSEKPKKRVSVVQRNASKDLNTYVTMHDNQSVLMVKVSTLERFHLVLSSFHRYRAGKSEFSLLLLNLLP